jgi:hypothetical protein
MRHLQMLMYLDSSRTMGSKTTLGLSLTVAGEDLLSLLKRTYSSSWVFIDPPTSSALDPLTSAQRPEPSANAA